ncbi:sensor histidine kinase [Jiella sp. M17.18]|uniref:sensor histidine kinase n=1 Tax=Jiella sp. M17.18 TaxID=3234247 RepID=UPI0034DEC9A7
MSIAAPPTYEFALRRGRNRDLAQTVRATRERLSTRGGLAPRFDRELLAQHAAALRAMAVVLPLPVMLTGFGLSLFTGPLAASLWTTFSLAAYLALVVLAHRFSSQPVESVDPPRWRLFFLLGHAAAGLCWAYLANFDCAACTPMRFDIFQFTVLFLAIASTAMISSSLKAAVPLTFAVPVALLCWGMIADPQPARLAMKAVLVGAVPFFAVVAEILRRSAIQRIAYQADKDELIAELETARLLSEEARRRAEDANSAKSQFLATISHELRTPLNAILGFSEVMTHEILGPIGTDAYKEYIGDIHASGQHLLGLINEILDLSRIEAGRYALNEEAVELVAIAKDCLAILRIKAEAKDLRLRAEFEPDLPALWADERAARQVIINLLSNAVKFTPRGGEIVLRVGWTAGGGQYVSIRDNGPGIPAEEIPIVLSSFGQGSSAIKSAEQGTGLGLPIVQALMKLHNGNFELLSRLREGTEAIAIFPPSRVLEAMPALDDYP